MSLHNGTDTVLIDNRFAALDERQFCPFMHPPQRVSTDATTVNPAFNPSFNRGIAILKLMIMYRQLVTLDMYRTEVAGIQVFAIFGYYSMSECGKLLNTERRADG